MSLQIKNLHVSVEEKEILHGIDIEIKPGEMHIIMGPNGAGKSTLANVIGAHPKYSITKGDLFIDDTSITSLPPDERAKKGIFLSLQHTPEIAGVSISNFLRIAHDAVKGTKSHPVKFHRALVEKAAAFGIDRLFLKRHLGVGLSGGEKKRVEMLQLSVLEPRYAILDETDSGLDVDALKIVSSAVNTFHTPEHGVLLITHYDKFLSYLKPDVVHVMIDGKIAATGEQELADDIAKDGYKKYQQ